MRVHFLMEKCQFSTDFVLEFFHRVLKAGLDSRILLP